MALSRGAKKSGSLERKIKDSLKVHNILSQSYVDAGMSEEEASQCARKRDERFDRT